MHSSWTVVVLALGTFAVIGQGKSSVCSLLTAKEMTDAVGATVGGGTDNSMVVPTGPQKGDTLHGCIWPAGEGTMVSVTTIRSVGTAEQRQAGLARLNSVFDGLKAKGWTEQRETFGTYRCSLMIPPASDKKAPNMTGCMGEVKGQGISVGFMSGTTKLPIDNVKTLFEKASARIS